MNNMLGVAHCCGACLGARSRAESCVIRESRHRSPHNTAWASRRVNGKACRRVPDCAASRTHCIAVCASACTMLLGPESATIKLRRPHSSHHYRKIRTGIGFGHWEFSRSTARRYVFLILLEILYATLTFLEISSHPLVKLQPSLTSSTSFAIACF